MSNISNYEQNVAWGYQKESECAELLQRLYHPEIFIRRSDVTDVIVPQKVMRDIPSQPNFNIFTPKHKNVPIYGWCEAARKTYLEFLAYKNSLYIKLKTFTSMEDDHYLIKPLVTNNIITDVVAIKRCDIVKKDAVQQSLIPRRDGTAPVGSGWNAIVSVNQYSDLVRGGKKAADTFLEALICPDWL